MKLHKIVKYLEKKFPINKAEKWDQIGFQKFNNKIIDLDLEISNILVCMEITNEVFEFIKEKPVQLIITRHPFIFNELKKEKSNDAKNSIIKFLTKNHILVYSIHTNYDYCGSNIFVEKIASVLKIKKVAFPFLKRDFINVKLANNTPMIEVIEQLKACFNSNDAKINLSANVDKKIDAFLINQGSGASAMITNQLSNTIFITGDAKWNEWIYANDNNIILITIGHYMENYFVNDIVQKLETNFSNLVIDGFDIKNQFKAI